MLKINIDEFGGFCWGVIRTIEIAEQELKNGNGLYSLGSIIHNPVEIERLEKRGLRTITNNELKNMQNAKILIRAHGEPSSTYKLAKENNLEIIDATCPVVIKVQERIRKFYDAGYQIVIFGKREHAEVIGLLGQIDNNAVVIRSIEEIDAIDLDRETVLFSQTTMDKKVFKEIKEILQERIDKLIVETIEETAIDFLAKDTICGQVSGREKKLKEFAQFNDVVVFVAGRSSSNGKVLFKICKSVNPKTYFVETQDEVKEEWFKNVKNVGITGATSTPKWLMEKIKEIIQLNSQNQ